MDLSLSLSLSSTIKIVRSHDGGVHLCLNWSHLSQILTQWFDMKLWLIINEKDLISTNPVFYNWSIKWWISLPLEWYLTPCQKCHFQNESAFTRMAISSNNQCIKYLSLSLHTHDWEQCPLDLFQVKWFCYISCIPYTYAEAINRES